MDQRLRLLTAVTVMLLGLGFASFFRRSSAEGDLPVAMQNDPLVLRKEPDARTFAVADASPPPANPQSAPAPQPRPASPTIVKPSDQPAPPPELPKSFPESRPVTGTRWGSSLREMLPESASAPATHKVVDGDTLASLAEQYLGSASRAMEIYEANRDVLADPSLLTIGVELKIPRPTPTANQEAGGGERGAGSM